MGCDEYINVYVRDFETTAANVTLLENALSELCVHRSCVVLMTHGAVFTTTLSDLQTIMTAPTLQVFTMCPLYRSVHRSALEYIIFTNCVLTKEIVDYFMQFSVVVSSLANASFSVLLDKRLSAQVQRHCDDLFVTPPQFRSEQIGFGLRVVLPQVAITRELFDYFASFGCVVSFHEKVAIKHNRRVLHVAYNTRSDAERCYSCLSVGNVFGERCPVTASRVYIVESDLKEVCESAITSELLCAFPKEWRLDDINGEIFSVFAQNIRTPSFLEKLRKTRIFVNCEKEEIFGIVDFLNAKNNTKSSKNSSTATSEHDMKYEKYNTMQIIVNMKNGVNVVGFGNAAKVYVVADFEQIVLETTFNQILFTKFHENRFMALAFKKSKKIKAQDDKTVYVGNVKDNDNGAAVAEALGHFGRIMTLNVVNRKDNSKIAFVGFYNKEDAQKAIDKNRLQNGLFVAPKK
ncbi:hypothetical protein EIN_275830 [Entamoeba invadens IP1]|uniref:RRM domain-containing protein n=1 Tax=Entamoeba invadens IP1 TaxID=370355 RepID=A0A0A1UBD3_ENTIV|nr:hypothetical protein EIN_275830 [Entamoeba invadens IP1]ELP92514.1 hypothetical protein EIN_275830 [Entamoeba invadens IP1]|eukprot:XP_004259285.1 hypothetical protein EIN_275830 [Entamoeba invadens IP1]